MFHVNIPHVRFFLFLCRLLYSLAFNARFLRHLWHLITSMTTKMITGWANAVLIIGFWSVCVWAIAGRHLCLCAAHFCLWTLLILALPVRSLARSSMVGLLQLISRGSPMSYEDSNRIIPLFYLFSSLFSHSLISVHDSEFFGHEMEGNDLLHLFEKVLNIYIYKKVPSWPVLSFIFAFRALFANEYIVQGLLSI